MQKKLPEGFEVNFAPRNQEPEEFDHLFGSSFCKKGFKTVLGLMDVKLRFVMLE